jgi:hypothetical protein
MKFDPKKPHGTITNHEWARYEQDGVLYDNQGNPREADEIEEEIDPIEDSTFADPINNNQRDFAYANAEAFLKNILAEGVISRSSIFKEASNNNQNWDKVKAVFADMGGEIVMRRNVVHWKLKTA